MLKCYPSVIYLLCQNLANRLSQNALQWLTTSFNNQLKQGLTGSTIKLLLMTKKIVISLRNRGFGEKENGDHVLRSYEALYLSYTKKLIMRDHDNMINFDDLVRILLKRDKHVLTRFMVYRDLRSRGYIPKEGFGFGVDFRVYERGEYEKKLPNM